MNIDNEDKTLTAPQKKLHNDEKHYHPAKNYEQHVGIPNNKIL